MKVTICMIYDESQSMPSQRPILAPLQAPDRHLSIGKFLPHLATLYKILGFVVLFFQCQSGAQPCKQFFCFFAEKHVKVIQHQWLVFTCVQTLRHETFLSNVIFFLIQYFFKNNVKIIQCTILFRIHPWQVL